MSILTEMASHFAPPSAANVAQPLLNEWLVKSLALGNPNHPEMYLGTSLKVPRPIGE